ncbi:uncharacterized protein DUF1049 [Desulfobotulus alkaliphilus]|uniref:Uncharacterized protein DUF1049 n=1 Tax=Desulfobotulus alkaliphilus TaxID=622671 RepID=A0A562S7K5_9BACT|nr:LapA family protein [Desulfobotulus alkaliphilus]TWI77405.1 uncharacterized protein DUF1049 [Desulfobotulus alkaliphilus]
MKQIKIILTLLTLGFIGLLVYQNLEYLLQPYAFSLNFYLTSYTFPEIPTGFYLIFCFTAGFLMMFLSSIVIRLRAAARLRMLHNENQEHLETIAALQDELAGMASGQTGQKTAQESSPEFEKE